MATPKLYRLTNKELDPILSLTPKDYTPGEDEEKDAELLKKVNTAWLALGLQMGFNWKTVTPHPSASPYLFYAEPIE